MFNTTFTLFTMIAYLIYSRKHGSTWCTLRWLQYKYLVLRWWLYKYYLDDRVIKTAAFGDLLLFPEGFSYRNIDEVEIVDIALYWEIRSCGSFEERIGGSGNKKVLMDKHTIIRNDTSALYLGYIYCLISRLWRPGAAGCAVLCSGWSGHIRHRDGSGVHRICGGWIPDWTTNG
jgi:hypothetical protein